jgi:hypothetical protein
LGKNALGIVMWKLFKDKNDINEKNVIGFISFTIMVLFAITDLVTGMLFMGYVGDGELIINDTIYNSFVFVTLGCFGISAFEKIKTK